MLPRTTVWRLKHRRAGVAECVFRGRRDGRTSLCVIGGREPSLEVFECHGTAMRRAREIAGSMIADGWRRVVAERTVSPATRSRRRLRLVARSASIRRAG